MTFLTLLTQFNDNERLWLEATILILINSLVTSTLRTDEMFKFLPIMMEMIVWKASDEQIDSLIKNIVNKQEDH